MERRDAVRPHTFWLAITALGLTQIIGYGTLYYAYALTAPRVAATLGTSNELLFAFLSVGFLCGGFLVPMAGKYMDEWGAGKILAIGSVAVAALYAVTSLSTSVVVYGLGTIALEIVAIMVQYDAAFAALAQITGKRSQAAITYITLFAGLSSTMFWPITGWLVDHWDWRICYLAFAAMHLFVVFPLHLWISRVPILTPAGHAKKPLAAVEGEAPPPTHAAMAFWAVAISFALSSALITAIGTHLVPLLKAEDLGASVYMVSMCVGPAQVLIRFTNATFWRNFAPVTSALIAALALPLSALFLLLPGHAVANGIAFAIIFGIGQGLFSITRGTVPLALFGPAGFGKRLGQLAAVRTLLSAGGPFAFAYVWQRIGLDAALWLGLAIGVIAALPLLLVRRQAAPPRE